MDIYFEEEYLKNYEIVEGGELKTFSYENEYGLGKNSFIKRKIEQQVGDKTDYDIRTPYGYGGPLFEIKEKEYKEKFINDFFEKFQEYCEKENIVSEFVRFHPLEKNYVEAEKFYRPQYISDTIFMDLSTEELINENMTSKARNMVRKAEKNNLVFEEDIKLENLKIFISLYYETMNKNNASSNYFFKKDFFENLFKLKNKVKLFNIKFDNRIISSSIILLGDKWLHYHLSANTQEGYKVAANNFLLYQVAKWGYQNGFKKFHLGGGFGGNESSLFKFKHSMNKNGIANFYVGRKIYMEDIYDRLVELRRFDDEELRSSFFPLYRFKEKDKHQNLRGLI